MKAISVVLVIWLFSSVAAYQMWKQCDNRWANKLLGFSKNHTICSHGSLLTSVTMIVTTISQAPGFWIDPPGMNDWLKQYNGYQNEDSFVWQSVKPLTLAFGGMQTTAAKISAHLGANHFVIINVRNGGHWALATGTTKTTIHVNDPYYEVTSYEEKDVVKFGWFSRVKNSQQIDQTQIQKIVELLTSGKQFQHAKKVISNAQKIQTMLQQLK